MQIEDQKADIIVPDDGESVTSGRSEPEKNVASEEQLAALKAQLEAAAVRDRASNERIEALTRDATAAKTAEQRAIEERFYAQEVAVANALAAAQSEAQALVQDMERYMAEGKAGELADASRKLARAELRIADSERQKQWVDDQKAGYTAAVEAERVRREQAARNPAPPQPQVSPKAKAWIDAHPRMATDQRYRDAAIGGHNLAIHKGIPVDSDEYFEFIETQLGEREPVDAGEPADGPEPAPVRRMVAAPPSRSTPTAQRQNERRLTLSAEEKSMADATMFHIKDPAERYKRYAANKQRMLVENPLA